MRESTRSLYGRPALRRLTAWRPHRHLHLLIARGHREQRRVEGAALDLRHLPHRPAVVLDLERESEVRLCVERGAPAAAHRATAGAGARTTGPAARAAHA